jgi:enoyl-CoA hydratase
MTQSIHQERVGEVLVCTFDREGSDYNAVDGEFHDELGDLMRSLKRERSARAIVFTGSKKAFSAGGDRAWFRDLTAPGKLDGLRRDGKQLIWDLLDIEQPIVAGLNGPAVGLAASIALMCDVIVMADTAIISDPHVRVGVVAGDGGAAIWPLLLGPLAAKRYLMTGDQMSAAEALAMGVATEVVPATELMDRTMAWAQRLADGPPLAVRATKMAVNQQVKQALLTSFDFSMAAEMSTFVSEDHQEALNALAERREPRFEGR